MKFLKFIFISLLLFVIIQADNVEKDKFSCESGICEEDPNYPEQVLNTLDLWKYNFEPMVDHKIKRSSDRSEFLTEKKLCDSRTSFIRPQKLKNTNGQFRTIVNHFNYTQIVKYETCSSENFPCTFNVFPQTVKSFCEQKYSPLKLLAFDEVQSCIVTEKFPIPSSCDCKIDQEDLLRNVK